MFLSRQVTFSAFFFAVIASLLLLADQQARADCTPAAASGVIATCTDLTSGLGGNGYGTGVEANISVTVNPGALVRSSAYGINIGDGTVINFGTIEGPATGIQSAANANVTNYGAITGQSRGIDLLTGLATVNNFGTITGTNSSGIYLVNGSASVTNSGTISGLTGIYVGTRATLTNSGTIIGTGGTAVQFNGFSGAQFDTVTVLPGARFGGLVDFGGGADTVKFGAGSWVLNTSNFDATLSTISTSGNPYVVMADRIIVADLSGFGAMNRAVMDITSWMNSMLPETPAFEPPPAGGANAFSAIEASSPRFDEAFANFPSDATGYASTKAPAFKGNTVNYSDGSNVWAKGFGGWRKQRTNGAFIGSSTSGYGGAMGYERRVTPGLRLGGFLGASTNKTNLDLNAGDINTDTVFGGLYGRSTQGASFLDLSLTGGQLDNDSKRNIGGGLTTETATASYKGWFLNQALTLGHRFAVPHNFTVTPAFKARYIVAQFDSFTETGSSSNLTVDSRNMQAFEERGEITLANVNDFGSHRVAGRMTVGILGQQRTGGSSVNVALLGQHFVASTPDQKSISGYYGGAGIDYQVGRIVLFASGEAISINDSTKIYMGRGGLRVAW